LQAFVPRTPQISRDEVTVRELRTPRAARSAASTALRSLPRPLEPKSQEMLVSRRSSQKPSWYLVATDDHMIPPLAQRTMAERIGATTTEVAGSHAIYVSQPAAVADLITQAARSAVRETTSVA
jgi:pimeloyl-ACP methyl ester carboxylesterase